MTTFPAVGKVNRYSLTVGLPHTNMAGLAEHLLLMQAGHMQWNSISRALGKPMSQLKTKDGKEIYATYYYVEEQFPADRPLGHFGLGNRLTFLNRLRHLKSISIDGEMIFDHETNLTKKTEAAFETDQGSFRDKPPSLHLCNVFISRAGGNEHLKLSSPIGVDLGGLDTLPPEENIYPIIREASQNLTFNMLDSSWASIQKRSDSLFEYPINPDRDTNGAGLVYFANYICFFDMAERAALLDSARRFSPDEINRRTLYKRKLAYFANVNLTDTLQISTSLFMNSEGRLGVRSVMRRKSDGVLVALTECEKMIRPL